MTIILDEMKINYVQYGKGSDVVLLHGWGQNIQMMRPLGDPLSRKFRVTIFDLPGFGDSDEPKKAFEIEDYVRILEEALLRLDVQDPIMIGHSFGGKISIVYASRNQVKKLVLLAAPCICSKKEPSFKVKMLKTLKKVPGFHWLAEKAKQYIGSRDYKNAKSPIMRDTLVKHVNHDVSDNAKRIQAPTLLIWGDLDTEVSLDEAKQIEQIIPDAGLVVFENGTHYAYLEHLPRLLKVLDQFL